MKDLPYDLVKVVEVLRASFEEGHFKAGHITRVFCYSMLHADDSEDISEYIPSLRQLKAIVGLGATNRFHRQLEGGTLSSSAKAYFDLYLDAVQIQLAGAFAHLVEISAANDHRLKMFPLDWAEFQARHLVRDQAYKIGLWIKTVCDKQIYDPNDDEEEQIFWHKWQAPKMLLMAPFMRQPYDASAASERLDAERSVDLLDRIMDQYVLHFDVWLRKRKGDALIELAKRPKSASRPAEPIDSNRNDDPRESPKLSDRANLRRDQPKRKETQALHGNWQKAYTASKKRRTEMSDVWHAQQIAKSEVGMGASVETIRKNMK